MKKTQITDVDVTSKRVTLRVNGAALALVKVPDGTSFGWRVQFPDNELGASIFANPERAIRWIASGQPVLRGSEAQESKVVAVPYRKKAERSENEEKEPEPEWELIKREPRKEPVWNGSFSSIPGGPTLLDPNRLVRQERVDVVRARPEKARKTATAPDSAATDAQAVATAGSESPIRADINSVLTPDP
jgi:hypothetical protein